MRLKGAGGLGLEYLVRLRSSGGDLRVGGCAVETRGAGLPWSHTQDTLFCPGSSGVLINAGIDLSDTVNRNIWFGSDPRGVISV